MCAECTALKGFFGGLISIHRSFSRPVGIGLCRYMMAGMATSQSELISGLGTLGLRWDCINSCFFQRHAHSSLSCTSTTSYSFCVSLNHYITQPHSLYFISLFCSDSRTPHKRIYFNVNDFTASYNDIPPKELFRHITHISYRLPALGFLLDGLLETHLNQ